MIIEDVEAMIRLDYQKGMTQKEIGEKYHVSQNHIGKLLSGQRRLGQMKLETFLKMFPKMIILLDGEIKSVSKSKREAEAAEGMHRVVLELFDNLPLHDRIKTLAFMSDALQAKRIPLTDCSVCESQAKLA